MVSEKIKEQRARLLSDLGDLVDSAKRVMGEMETVQHSRGTAYRSLKPKSGMSIIHSESGFMAEYHDSDGVVYSINVHKEVSDNTNSD